MRRRTRVSTAALAAAGLLLGACSGDDDTAPEPTPTAGDAPAVPPADTPTTGPADDGTTTSDAPAPEVVEATLPADGPDPVARAEFFTDADGVDNSSVDILTELTDGAGYEVEAVCSGEAGSTVEYEVTVAEPDPDPDVEETGTNGRTMSAELPCGELRRDTFIPVGSPVPRTVQISFTQVDDGVTEASAVVVPRTDTAQDESTDSGD